MAQGQSSKHLATARGLLDSIDTEAADPQTRASAATAHAILVLAEQVAVARVVMATEAVESVRQNAAAQ